MKKKSSLKTKISNQSQDGFLVFSQLSSTFLIGKVGPTFLCRPNNCNVIIFSDFFLKRKDEIRLFDPAVKIAVC